MDSVMSRIMEAYVHDSPMSTYVHRKVVDEIVAIADPKYDANSIKHHFHDALNLLTDEVMEDGIRAGMLAHQEIFTMTGCFNETRAERDYKAYCNIPIKLRAETDKHEQNGG